MPENTQDEFPYTEQGSQIHSKSPRFSMGVVIIFIILFLLLIIFAVSQIGSSRDRSQIILRDAQGNPQLVYAPRGHIQPQVETVEDIRVLVRYIPQVIKDAQSRNKLVTVMEIRSALESKHYRQVEQLMVEYIRQHRTELGL